jgi:ABC-type sugar transport system substrate-binding protein
MKMKKKSMSVAILALAATMLLNACGSSATASTAESTAPAAADSTATSTAAASTAASTKKLNIGSVILNTSGEWFSEVINGMNAAAKDLDVNVQIASADNDVSKEADQLDNFIAQKVDGICVSPQNSAASIPAFERVVAANIPIVAWNTNVESDKSKYFVGVDNTELGSKTGEYFANYVKTKMSGKAKVAVIGIHKYEIGLDRVNGFLKEAKTVPGIDIIANQDAELKEEGMKVTENILQAHPETQVIWCWNQTSLEGCIAALKGLNRSDIKVMGTDMSVSLAKTMLEDKSFLMAITTQQPYKLGYDAVKNAVALAKGQTVDGKDLIPVLTYSVDDKTAIQKYIDDRKDLVK